jgi:HlyD family secretion protein
MTVRKPSAPKKTNRRRKTIWGIFLLLVLAGGGAAGWYFLFGPGNASKTASAQSTSTNYTTTVQRGDLRISTTGTGKLVAYQSADLNFSTGGTIQKLDVKLGDTVKAGQELATLGSSDTLQANLASAQLQLLQDQQDLANLQDTSASTLNLAQAYSDYVTAQQSYQDANTKYERMAYARCSEATNKKNKQKLDMAQEQLDKLKTQEYDAAKLSAAQTNYQAALDTYNYCISYTADEKTNAKASLDIAQAKMKQAEDTYNTLKAASGIDPDKLALAEAKITTAEAQVAQAKEDLAGITLYAPFDGKVTALSAVQGTVVGTSAIMTISDISVPLLTVGVNESNANTLVAGTPVEVTFDALPDQVFKGQISKASPQLTQFGEFQGASGWAELTKDAAPILAKYPLGLNASVTIITKEATNALLVPITALRDLGDNQYAVFVKQPNGSLRLTVVQVGIKDTTYAQITSGLKDGDVVSTGIAESAK